MKYSIQQGFTLIEMTMVLFILGLLMASFLNPLASRVEQEERNATQIQLDEIEEILYGYVLQNHYLPCPDCSVNTGGCTAVEEDHINDGGEDTVDGTGTSLICANDYGNLPWLTLGIKGTDEWNNIFTYRVDGVFTDRNNPDKLDETQNVSDGTTTKPDCAGISATLNVSFSLCSNGNIEVRDSDSGNIVASSVPAIVVSHGKNWAVSNSDDENQNTG